MTDKQIIVDNVDVSGCEHVFARTSLFKEKNFVECTAFFLENEDSRCNCSDNPNCYYKQLDQLKAENKKLKQTLTDIKEIVEEVYNDCDNCYRDVDTNSDIDCIDCTLGGKAKLAKQILQKISEVINE